MKYFLEALFLIANIAIADYHAHQFAKGKSISHSLWALIVGLLISAAWYFTGRQWIFALALLLERTWVFNPALNLFRQKPFFYTNSGKGGSWIDAHIGNSYPYIFWASWAGFITIQFFL